MIKIRGINFFQGVVNEKIHQNLCEPPCSAFGGICNAAVTHRQICLMFRSGIANAAQQQCVTAALQMPPNAA